MLRTLLFAVSLACISTNAKGHEFWIDPKSHQVAPGETILAEHEPETLVADP